MQMRVDGFSAVELIVVLAIIAILSLVGLPTFKDMILRNTIKQAAESLKSDIQFARTEAIKQSQNIAVSRNTGNDGAWCYGISTAACDCSTAGSCTIRTVTGANFGGVDLDFVSALTTFSYRRGTANASNTCFSFSDYTLKVYTSSAGRTQICSDGASSAGPSCASLGLASCP